MIKKGSPSMQSTTPCTKHAIAKKLTEFWLPHLVATEDLFTHLRYVDTSGKGLRAEALRLELQAFDDLLAKDVPTSWRLKEYRRRTIITLVGKITYMRRIYSEPSGICHAYLDEILGIRTRFKLAPDAFIWIVKTAADISFRKTAQAFYERTGAKISHWLVMSCVHEEGTLILEEAYQRAFGDATRDRDGLPFSSEILFVEWDGVHIPLQKSFHGPRIARHVYEHDRKKRSFELKVANFYAGKDARGRRLGCAHFAFDGAPSYFWPLLDGEIASVYDTEVIHTVHTSSDAAGWCMDSDLALIDTASEVSHHLDRYHLNREIRRAFGGKSSKAAHFIRLAYEKRMKRLVRDLQLVINHAKDKERYLSLQSYLTNNLALIEKGRGPSMGTQEGSNAHVYAARMKVWGGAWSRKGGACMAAVRARLASKKELIFPTGDNVLYDDYQITRRRDYEEDRLIQRKNYTPESEGKGYEGLQARIALSTHMPSKYYGLLRS